jgi:uncharacterized Tic20 family protein
MTQQPIAQPYTPRPLEESGTVTHALGFLAYVPIPYLSILITGLIQVLSYRSVRKRGPRAAEVARPAGNWGATLLLVMAVLIALEIILIAGANGQSSFLPFIPLFGFLALCVTHLVVTIGGTMAASKGLVYRNPLAIQFFKN